MKRRNDGLNPARGCLNAIIAGGAIWAVLLIIALA